MKRLGCLLALGLQGCIASWTGHRVQLARLQDFTPGLTTPAQVEAALGKPENVMFNSAEKVTVYMYQSVRSVSLVPPFPVSLGRSAQKGYTVNVMFKDGVMRGYELVQMRQRILWR